MLCNIKLSKNVQICTKYRRFLRKSLVERKNGRIFAPAKRNKVIRFTFYKIAQVFVIS